MKPLRITGKFKKDLKRMESRGYRLEKLTRVVNKLRQGSPLSAIEDDHPLKGPWDSFRAVMYKAIGASSTETRTKFLHS